MTVLGIDLGTSQVKALLCADSGAVLGRGAAGYPVRTPRPGWAETDPSQWWRAVRVAVRATGPAVAEVSAIAVTGQMHGLVLVSQRHRVLGRGILWLDRRAVAEAAQYLRLPAASRALLGNAPSPGMAGPIALWLARHEPEVYRAARWQLQPKDWLRLRLTGEVATDPTDASGTLLYDVPGDRWADEVITGLGLRAELLPPVLRCDEVAGRLLPGAAAELSLPPGIPVLAGCADTAASLLAAGLDAPGWALLTLGTGGQWIVPAPAPAPDPSGRTNLFRAVEGWYRLAAAQNVGVTLDWVRRLLEVTWDDLYAAAAHAASADPPLFEPRLVAERWDAEAAGAGWTGLRLGHGRDDLLRAALAGVAGLLRDRLADLRAAGCQPASVLLSGGGAGNPAWRDLLSSTLGVPLVPARTTWLTAAGAALLARRVAAPDQAGRS